MSAETSSCSHDKRISTVNPKRLERTKYAGYLEIDPSTEYSGFFNIAHAPATDRAKSDDSCPQ